MLTWIFLRLSMNHDAAFDHIEFLYKFMRLTSALLTIAAHQFDDLVEFYHRLLQQQPVTYRPSVYAEFHLPGLTLGIFRPKESSPPSKGNFSAPMGMSLCIEVEDLEAAIAHLTQLGYPPPNEIITASHGREVYAYDPEGNGLILHQSH